MQCLFKNVYIDYDFNLNKNEQYYILVSELAGNGFLPEHRGKQLVSANTYESLLENYFSTEEKVSIESLEKAKPNNFSFEKALEDNQVADEEELLATFSGESPEIKEESTEKHEEKDEDNTKEFTTESFIFAERKLWDFLLEFPADKTLALYLDKKTYDRFFIKYLSNVYPDREPEFLYEIYDLYHIKDTFYISQLGRDTGYIEQKLITLAKLTPIDFEEIMKSPDGFRYLDREGEQLNLAIEFLLAHYLSSKDKFVERKIANEVKKVCWRYVASEVSGFRRDLLRNYLNLSFIYEKLKGWDPLAKNAKRKMVMAEPRLAFLIDNEFQGFNVEKVKEYSGEILECYEIYLKKMREETELVNKILRAVLGGNDFDPLKMLNVDIENGFASFIFGTGPTERSINPYFISHIYKLYRDNDPKLKKFTLTMEIS